jgi:hypothetical protein
MRCCRFIPLVVFLFAFRPSLACAEPIIQTLPEDGAWVRYHVNLSVAGQATTPAWTVKSVGKKDVAGVAHRWIELQSKQQDRNEIAFKCLVAETEFGKGKNPLAHALQVFVKYADQEPREVESIAAADTALALILAGPAEAKKLDAKESVEMQSGRIECDVYTGTAKSEIGTAKVELTYRLLKSDKIPYGLAGAKFQIEADLAGNKLAGSAELSLKETGKDAKSELPTIE